MIRREEYEYTPKEGFILAHFLTVTNVKRSADFYLRILGGNIVLEGNQQLFKLLTVGLF